MEFPRDDLLNIARLIGRDGGTGDAALLRQAVKAFDELSERCVMDRTALSLEIANLREQIRQLEEKS